MEARKGRDGTGGSMPCTTARPGCAGRRKDNSGRNVELPKCEASGTCRLVPVPTAAARPDGTDGRAAAWLAWPPSAVLYAFGVEGALRPLADSAGQALSRFMPSASIHKARLILTFWSIP